MSEVHRYFPARNMKGDPSGICPVHAQKWTQYSDEWYRACNEAFVRAMWYRLGLKPVDPRERRRREIEQQVRSGEIIIR